MTTTYVLERLHIEGPLPDDGRTLFLSVDGISRPPRAIFVDDEAARVPPHFVRALEDHINHLQFDFALTEDFCFSVLLGKSQAVRASHAEAVRKINPNQLVLDGV